MIAGCRRRLSALLAFFATLLFAAAAYAVPEAHIMRIDPRSSQTEGAPVLTTVVELMQSKSVTEIVGACGALTGNANYDCISEAMEKPGATWSAIDFYQDNAVFTVMVDGAEVPGKFLSKKRWGEAKNEDGVGTAWVILIDAAATMGDRFDEARTVAQSFVNAMGPQDIVTVMFFNDRSVVQNSRWVSDKNAATAAINSVTKTYPNQGRNRALFNIIKNATTDAFKELGNAGSKVKVPMHQALVILSNGVAGADAGSTGPVAVELKKYLNNGRFPEDNVALPKAPLPVISLWFPSQQMDEFAVNSRAFMEELANPEIGGFHTVIRNGQADHGPRIVSAVRARFDKMWIAKWQVPCVAPQGSQTFKLYFRNTNPVIAPDATFANVPVILDPAQWPLDVDMEQTIRNAEKNPLYPGGKVKIFGNFCWGGKKERAELYMVPKSQQLPESLAGGSLEDAKNAQKTLIEAGMAGQAITTTDAYVEFQIPDKDKFLIGKGDKLQARLVVYDNVAKRTSPVTAEKIITLKAQEPPLNLFIIGGAVFGGVVLILLLVAAFRGGSRNKRGGSAAAPPKPIAVGGGGGMGGGGMGGGMQPGMGGPPMPGPSFVSRATLSGPHGIFTVLPGMEMKAGRDGALCQILIQEPRVSGTHATLKIEGGQLYVRDDNSNNGTTINGQRLPPSTFMPIPQGAQLRFGPIEFVVNLE